MKTYPSIYELLDVVKSMVVFEASEIIDTKEGKKISIRTYHGDQVPVQVAQLVVDPRVIRIDEKHQYIEGRRIRNLNPDTMTKQLKLLGKKLERKFGKTTGGKIKSLLGLEIKSKRVFDEIVLL